MRRPTRWVSGTRRHLINGVTVITDAIVVGAMAITTGVQIALLGVT